MWPYMTANEKLLRNRASTVINLVIVFQDKCERQHTPPLNGVSVVNALPGKNRSSSLLLSTVTNGV